MNLQELIKILPDLFNCFVPGYICIKIFRYFSANDYDENIDVKLIESVVISYIFSLISESLCNSIKFLDSKNFFVSVACAVATAFIAMIIRRSWWYKLAVEKVGRVSNESDIWKTVLPRSNVAFSCKYNDIDVFVEGDVKYFETTKDGECNIVLEKFTIYNTEEDAPITRPLDAYFIINTKKIQNMEILQDRKR